MYPKGLMDPLQVLHYIQISISCRLVVFDFFFVSV